ncbi:MAG TPA: serine/threonine-protein kinase [Acidimicrobiales bacterium]|nr:serine/threonine-protein kinase [Acidimicrobiales bacterium]
MAIAEDILRIGQAMPDYDIERELGRGGMGIVFLGRHRRLLRGAAIKELPPTIAAEQEVRARFTTEAQTLAGLEHPHIVPIFDYVERDGLCLIVMQELPGGSVWDRFTTTGLTPPTACAVVMACCAALQHAHDRGVLHLDVKPDNLMFDAESAVKVTDFGISRVITGGRTLGTVDGQVLGTPAYMSPEQARGDDLTAASDVYAAGVMLYELLSGQLPWLGAQTAAELLQQRLQEDPIPLREQAPAVPQGLADVVMQALSRDVDDRYQQAEDFGVAIGEACVDAWGPSWLDHAGVALVGSERLSLAARTTGHVSRAATPATAVAPAEVPAEVLDLTDARTTGGPVIAGAAETGVVDRAGAAPAARETSVRPSAPAAPATGAVARAAPETATSAPAAPSAPATSAVPPATPAPAPETFGGSAPPEEPVAPPEQPASPPDAEPAAGFEVVRAASPDVRIKGVDLADLELADLINVEDILDPPRRPWRPVLLTVAAFGAALLLGLLGLGSNDRDGDLIPGTVSIAGTELFADDRIDLDLSRDVVVEVSDPELAAGADEVEVVFSVLDRDISTMSGALRDGQAVIDPGLAQRLVGGAATADVRLLSRDDVVASQHVGVRATQPWYLTAPFAVGLLLVLLAYAELETSLKPLRSGHTRIRSYIGAAIWCPVTVVGVLLVVSSLGLNELTRLDVAVALALGCLGGLALVRARTALARRHRVRTAVKRAEKRLGVHVSR